MSADLSNSKVLLLGYGREGESTHRFLLRHYPGAVIGIADLRAVTPIPEAPAGTRVYQGPSYLDEAGSYDVIVHTPVISMRDEKIAGALRRGQRITSATNLFFDHAPGRTVGVTGTKGKSTTSSLIAAILKTHLPDVRLAGNIGRPMLEDLEGSTEDTTFILELSSFQLEDLTKSPDVAVLLNIVPEHLDHHGSFDDYRNAKANITAHQSSADLLVYNETFSLPAAIARQSKAQRRPFGIDDGTGVCWLEGGDIIVRANGERQKLLAASELPLRGPGNLQNAMAAAATAILLGVPPGKIRAAIAEFQPLEHRLEICAVKAGITFVNDSLSTIPEALIQAIDAFPSTIDTVIAGGFDRGLDYSAVGPALARSGARTLITFPTTGDKIWEALEAAGPHSMTRFQVTSMEEAVELAYRHTRKGGVCVLSPASSSFNLFRDYRERGDRFKNAVEKLSVTPP